jgi:hypothetical protein
MMKRFPDKILRVEIWQRLAEAVRGEDPDWKTAWVSSQRADGGPALRMMVLRAANEEKRELVFFTDSRSPKWSQLDEKGSEAELGFWSPERKVQLRCRGDVTLHENNEMAQNYRAQVPSQGASDYTAAQAPGTGIASPEEGWQTQDDWHFGVLVVTVTRLDWLQLDRAGHQRACFHWQRDCWASEWVQP